MSSVYVITGRTDMWKSFDSLILLIQDTYQLDPYSKSVFLFCGRNTSKLKALYHDRDGWVLMHKRLDGEGRFQWPRSPSEARLITRQQLRLPGLLLAVPGPAKSNPGNRKEKRYLIFVQNRESEKFFSISCEAEKAVIHCRLRYRYLRVEDTDKPYTVRSRKWISPEKYQFPAV